MSFYSTSVALSGHWTGAFGVINANTVIWHPTFFGTKCIEFIGIEIAKDCIAQRKTMKTTHAMTCPATGFQQLLLLQVIH